MLLKAAIFYPFYVQYWQEARKTTITTKKSNKSIENLSQSGNFQTNIFHKDKFSESEFLIKEILNKDQKIE